MTPLERADIIIDGLVGSPQFEEGDKDFVVKKLAEYRLDVIREAVPLVCGSCAAGHAPTRIVGVVHVSPVWRHTSSDGTSWHCQATPLLEILESERQGYALPLKEDKKNTA